VKIPSKSPLSTRGLSDSKCNSSIADDYHAHKQQEVPCNSSITGDAAAQEQEIPLSSEMESVSDADMNMIQCLPAELVHLVCEAPSLSLGLSTSKSTAEKTLDKFHLYH
jgi:hypothetical protein